MATWYDTASLDALLNDIKGLNAGTGEILLINGYTQGDSYATVTSNAIGNASIATADFSGPASSGNDRVLTFSGATGVATQTVLAGQPLHLAITDGTSRVLAVTDETSDQAVTSGNTLNFPTFTMTAKQPTQVA